MNQRQGDADERAKDRVAEEFIRCCPEEWRLELRAQWIASRAARRAAYRQARQGGAA